MNNKKICNFLQDGYIRRYVLSEGNESGLKVIELDNGCIRLLLNESKGLDVMQLWHKGTNISFVSKNGFTTREIPFLNRFEGGMLYTCGLDSMGRQEGYELHGSYHSTPAKILQTNICEEYLQIVAEMQYSSLFGPYLVMKRTVTLYKGDNGYFEMKDELNNRGTKDEDYCLLYHINLGYPMLDSGVEIKGDFGKILPRSKHAEEWIDRRATFLEPIDNEEESCYALENLGDEITVINKKIGKKFLLSYSKDTLPYLIQWNSLASYDYALGLEPSTSILGEDLKYSKLNAGEKVNFTVKIRVEEV